MTEKKTTQFCSKLGHHEGGSTSQLEFIEGQAGYFISRQCLVWRDTYRCSKCGGLVYQHSFKRGRPNGK